MNPLSGFFMGEHMAYSVTTAQAMANNPVQMAAWDKARQADPPTFEMLRNAFQPTVNQRDRWMCEDLGIPVVAEDTQ